MTQQRAATAKAIAASVAARIEACRETNGEPTADKLRAALGDEVVTAAGRYRVSGDWTAGGDVVSRVALLVVVLERAPSAAELMSAAFERHRLTKREAEVARLLARRASTAEIAAALGISPHTARHHAERVLAKLGVRSRAAAAAKLASEVGPADDDSS